MRRLKPAVPAEPAALPSAAAAVKPDQVIFVMDGSIGQAAFDQAKAFKDSVEASSAPFYLPFAFFLPPFCLLC
jgi:hypothetical protein